MRILILLLPGTVLFSLCVVLPLLLMLFFVVSMFVWLNLHFIILKCAKWTRYYIAQYLGEPRGLEKDRQA
jgi:hypothetical protein